MEATIIIQHFFRDIILTIKNYRTVYPFIMANKLWEGFLDYSWVSKFLLVVGALLSLKFGGVLSSWMGNVAVEGMSMNAFGSLVSDTASEGYHLYVQGGFKYVILILLEVVLFHFARKTLEVLTGEEAEDSLKAFIGAQVRMIKVVFFSYFMETFFSIVVGTLVSMIGFEFLKPALIFAIQCFFLGFVVVDNYNEIYKMSIKQSFKYTRQYTGVSIGIGIVVYALMLLPVLGAFLAPLLAAVTATITMYELDKKDDSLEEVIVKNVI